jgi:hypothetical protein
MKVSTFFILLFLFGNKYTNAQTDFELIEIAYQKKSSYLLGEIFENYTLEQGVKILMRLNAGFYVSF